MKKIAIIGSTGSIGKTLLKIIKQEKEKFKVVLLTANKDYKTLLSQANEFDVKNLIISNLQSYQLLKKKNKKKIKIYQNYDELNNIFKKKIDYVMSAATGIDGLSPTIKIIKHTNTIAIANKESIICGWSLIIRELKKNKTKFIPVDSEHFSIWQDLRNINKKKIDKIYLTASGGPLLNLPIEKIKNVKINQALRHPNWKMGKKISIDSATLINKVYEVIEAKNIFNISYQFINILVHPKSYIHAIIKLKNGLIKIIAHETTMKIPIFNSLYSDSFKEIKSNNIDLKKLNNLNLQSVNVKKFPMINILKYLPKKNSLYETIIVSTNDTLVNLFLEKKIKFNEIQKILFQVIKMKEFLKYKKISAKSLSDITNLDKYVRLKVIKKVYKNIK